MLVRVLMVWGFGRYCFGVFVVFGILEGVCCLCVGRGYRALDF